MLEGSDRRARDDTADRDGSCDEGRIGDDIDRPAERIREGPEDLAPGDGVSNRACLAHHAREGGFRGWGRLFDEVRQIEETRRDERLSRVANLTGLRCVKGLFGGEDAQFMSERRQ